MINPAATLKLISSALLTVMLAGSPSFAGDLVTAARIEELKSRVQPGGVWRCDRFDGGELMVAVIFGYWLRHNNVSVEIRAGEYCASAAAVAAMGGTRLFKSTLGRLIFHGPSRSLTPKERSFLLQTFQYWRVPQATAERIVDLAPGEIWSLREARLRTSHRRANSTPPVGGSPGRCDLCERAAAQAAMSVITACTFGQRA